AELSLAVAAFGVLGIDPKDPVPVRIERQRPAMRQNLIAQRSQVGFRAFRRGEMQRDQSARRVIDEHNQRASWRAAFKPIVRTAVNLDQFTEPGAAVPALKNALLAPLLR